MSSQEQRDPFAPFLSKLPTEDNYKDYDEATRQTIEAIRQKVEEIKAFASKSKKWEEFISGECGGMIRKLNESLGDNDSQQPATTKITEFFSSQEGEDLKRRIEGMVPKDILKLQEPPLGHPLSKPNIEELTKHEKELQERAEEENERDPGAFILEATYDDLEHQLKQCLLCFSAFPPHTLIKKRNLIHWWIGEGLVCASPDDRTAEQVGEDCFKMLIASGLIEPIYQRLSTYTANYCKIYPWVRQMLVSKSREAEFLSLQPENHDPPCDRVCLAVENEKESADISKVGFGREGKLTSLFNSNVHRLNCDQQTLQKMEAMATLQLGRWQNLSTHHIEVDNDSFLNGLESLTQLKYLSLHGISRIASLPDSIAKLTNLLILDLRSCHNLEFVNPEVTSLRSLTHLDVSGCYLLEKMPQGIGSMPNLQVLKGFVLGGAGSCELIELTKLKKLWKLSIRIGREAQVDNDLRELGEITSLRSLRITWGQVKQKAEAAEKRTNKPHLFEIGKSKTSIKELATLPDLEKLALECVPDDESVRWLKPEGFAKLRRLYIEGGKLSKLSLVSGGDHKRWNIEILRLSFLKKLKLEWADIGQQQQPCPEQKLTWADVRKELPQLRGAQIYKCAIIGFELDGFEEKGIWVKNNKGPCLEPVDGVRKITEEGS